MKTNGNDKALEAYKIFPYIAWVLVVSFTLFVYNLTMDLKDTVKELQVQSQYLQEHIQVTTDQPTSDTAQ